jgi:hypothetical protein
MLKGNLKTISLPSLVQAICLEQRRAALYLESQGLEGVMYFDLGQIAHASLGNLVGDEAVMELVCWEEGSFYISSYDLLPRRTITASWNYLLMEGMRQLDEKRLQPASAQSSITLTDSQIDHDGRVENGLITMLSNLEYNHSSLMNRSGKRIAGAIIHTLAEMVSTVDKYLDAAPVPMDKIGQSDYVAPELTGGNGQAPTTYQESARRLKDLLPSQGEIDSPPQSGEALETLVWKMLDLLEGYLCLFSHHYYSPFAADQWIEASTIFVTELRQTLSDLNGQV